MEKETNREDRMNCTECPYEKECMDGEWAGGCPVKRGIYGPESW